MRKQFNLKDWLKDKSQKIETRNGRPAHYIGLDRAGWQVFEIFRTNETSEYKTYHDSYLYSGPGESPYDLFIVTPEEELTEWQRFISACLQKHGLLDCGAADRIAKESDAELLSLAREQFIKDGYVIEKKAFHDAVEKVSPEVMKEVSDNVDKAGLNEFEKVVYECAWEKVTCKKEGESKEEYAIRYASELLSLAEKELEEEIPELEFEPIEETLEYKAGYRAGKAGALKDLPRWKKAKEYMELGPDDFVFTLDSDGKCLPYWDTKVEEGQFYITESDIENLPKEDEK